MRPPKISVIMPAYNVERYIDEAIGSVLAQRGVPFELLIGDDASTDATWARIQTYRRDPRVRAWRFRRHRGVGAMRNHLAVMAVGSYLAMCDADDLFRPRHLKRGIETLERRPTVGVVYTDLLVADGRDSHRTWVKQFANPREGWDFLGDTLWNPGTFIRRSVFNEVGGYRPELPFMVDSDLFLRLAEVTKFQHLPGRPLYCYRSRPRSLSDQPHRRRFAVWKGILRDTIRRRYGLCVPW